MEKTGNISGKGPKTPNKRRRRGFEAAGALLRTPIRSAGEKRGFAVTRLLTHWEEVVGEEIAKIARPVKVGYGRQGLGASLTVLTTGAYAPMLEMQKAQIKDRVNACYGYAAISRVLITQTAPTGFSEGRATFNHAPKPEKPAPTPETLQEAARLADGVADEGLRTALEKLAQNVLSKTRNDGVSR